MKAKKKPSASKQHFKKGAQINKQASKKRMANDAEYAKKTGRSLR